MLLSGDMLISDCCKAVIVMDGEQYQCIKCLKHCGSGGTLADLHAPKKERKCLRDEVINAAVEEYKFEYAADNGSNTMTRAEALIKMQRAVRAKREAVAALLNFEAKQER